MRRRPAAMSLGVGILGASRIAPIALVAPARETGVATPLAVAARVLARAEAFAAEHGVPHAVEGYLPLLEQPGLDAIYNSLPTARHADLTVAALAKGRHVLCEKPFAMSAAEARAMVAEAQARGLILMEAFHYRYHPMFARLLEALSTGAVGDVRRIEAVFHAPIPHAEGELRYDPALGGGALMDLGAYCVHWCRAIAAAEPAVAWAEHLATPTGVDLATRAELRFPGGLTGRISCHMAAVFEATIVVTGSAGILRAHNPLVPQYGAALIFETAGGSRTEGVSRVSTYACQLRAFADAVRARTQPLTGGADAIAQMVAIEAVRAASRPVSAAAFARPRA